MKNKKILIISTIVVTILIIAAVLGALYFTTDLFKTEQQLFYKYIAQTKVMDSSFIKQYEVANERIVTNNNSSSANLDVSLLYPNQETGVADLQKILNIKSNALENTLLKQSYRDFVFSSNDQNFLTLKYIRDNNTYAISADNIVNKYLAVENSNLKELFTKLGVQDVNQIPDSIPTNYEEILKIDETILEQLKGTYGTLIYNNIAETNFFKIKNEDKTETIGVSLTEQEVFNLLKLLLETAKNDTTILNLIISKAQLLNYNNITVESVQAEIQVYIDEIANNTYSTDKDFLKISLIKKDKQVIKLQFESNYIDETIVQDEMVPTESTAEKNKINIEFDFSEVNKLALSIKENDIELIKMVINYLYDSNNISFNVEVQAKEGEETNSIKAQYQINNYQTENIMQNLLIDTSSSLEETYQLSLVNNITLKQDIQISKLTTENSAKLNDMTSEQLSQLFTALVNRINEVYGESLSNLYSNNIIINSEQAS